MTPKQLATALTNKPITDARLAKFRAHIHGNGTDARKPKDESFARDTLAAIEQQAGAETRERVQRALTNR